MEVMKTQINVSLTNHPLPELYLEGSVEPLYKAASEMVCKTLVERSASRLNVLK